MKKTISFIFLFFLSCSSFAQSAFDKAIGEISSDLAGKLSQKEKKKVVVLYVTDINKATTVAGKYLADIISVNIVNNPGNFQVFDRENLSGIAEANKLIAEGYIDVDKAKELGKLLSVEAIIIGNYTVLSNTIKLTTKALDANTGFVMAAAMKDLPLDGDAGALLGINVSTTGTNNQNANNSNRGFNAPLNSNEQYNNPETVNKECEEKNTGDYCFTNSTNVILSLNIYGNGSHSLSLNPGQTQCFYNLRSREWNYNYTDNRGSLYPKAGSKNGNGQILIEKCKSKTQTIR